MYGLASNNTASAFSSLTSSFHTSFILRSSSVRTLFTLRSRSVHAPFALYLSFCSSNSSLTHNFYCLPLEPLLICVLHCIRMCTSSFFTCQVCKAETPDKYNECDTSKSSASNGTPLPERHTVSRINLGYPPIPCSRCGSGPLAAVLDPKEFQDRLNALSCKHYTPGNFEVG